MFFSPTYLFIELTFLLVLVYLEQLGFIRTISGTFLVRTPKNLVLWGPEREVVIFLYVSLGFDIVLSGEIQEKVLMCIPRLFSGIFVPEIHGRFYKGMQLHICCAKYALSYGFKWLQDSCRFCFSLRMHASISSVFPKILIQFLKTIRYLLMS